MWANNSSMPPYTTPYTAILFLAGGANNNKMKEMPCESNRNGENQNDNETDGRDDHSVLTYIQFLH